MFKNLKRLTVGALGVALVGGLLFGSNLVPYAQTAFNNVRATAEDSVSVPFQIDAAKGQLAKIGPEIKNMVHQIAKEQVQINRLKNELKLQENRLEDSYDQMRPIGSKKICVTDSKFIKPQKRPKRSKAKFFRFVKRRSSRLSPNLTKPNLSSESWRFKSNTWSLAIA